MAQHAFSKSQTDWGRVGKRGLWILLAGILTVVGFLFYAFKINQFSISVRLIGEDTVSIEYGESYVDAGAELIVEGTRLFTRGIALRDANISCSGELNEAVIGRYVLTYTGSFWGMSAECQRTVTVLDTVSPVITLTKDETKRWHIGYTAVDNYDGDISDRVKCVESLGRISFAVIDSSGNPAYIEKSVPFYDIDPPQIQLVGGDEYTIPVGFLYSEPGYSAIDNADGIMTEQVLVEGEVNWFLPGTYPITYTAIDSVGNEGTVVRNVNVIAKERPTVVMPEYKTIYLTFDDGPSPYTKKLLDILDRYQVKATFFVKSTEYNEIMKEIVDRGHSIGIHTVSHDYAEIYASPEAFYNDLRNMQEMIQDNTGVVTTLMRFPGGSSNTVSVGMYPGLMSILTESVQDAGYQYFDWNVDSNDAGGARDAKTVAENVIRGIEKEPVSIVLQHDIHEFSVDAVEQIIQWCQARGYTFLPLSATSPGFHHPINN